MRVEPLEHTVRLAHEQFQAIELAVESLLDLPCKLPETAFKAFNLLARGLRRGVRSQRKSAQDALA